MLSTSALVANRPITRAERPSSAARARMAFTRRSAPQRRSPTPAAPRANAASTAVYLVLTGRKRPGLSFAPDPALLGEAPLETEQHAAQDLLEGGDLLGPQGLQAFPRRLGVQGQDTPDGLASLRGEHDGDTPAVDRVGLPFDEPSSPEPVETPGHAARGHHDGVRKLGRRQAAIGPGTLQGLQDLEVRSVDAEPPELVVDALLDMTGETVETAEDAQSPEVHIRTPRLPLLEDDVDAVLLQLHGAHSTSLNTFFSN